MLPDSWFVGIEKDAFFTGIDESNDFNNENIISSHHELSDESASIPKLREKMYRPRHTKHSKKDKYR